MRIQRHPDRPRSLTATTLTLLATSSLLTGVAAQDSNNSTSPSNSTQPSTGKRGLSIHGNTNTEDFNIFLQKDSPVAWYYTWSPWPNEYIEKAAKINGKQIEFIPLLHGIDNLDSDIERVAKLDTSQSNRLLTFNEPDGDKNSGGSDISPKDAAKAYIEKILPLRKGNGNGRWQISHPVVTGSGRGLDWLKDFCDACADINGDDGCPTDFIAAHWYGAFDGLENHLKQLREFYEDPKHSFRPDLGSGTRSRRRIKRADNDGAKELEIIVTEMGLPQQDAQATETMLNQTIPYLDKADWVSGYSWFGLFREGSTDANGWAGEAVAMLNGDGKLTEIGSMFMGGQDSGFAPGESVGGDQSGDGSGSQGNAGTTMGAHGLTLALCFGAAASFLIM